MKKHVVLLFLLAAAWLVRGAVPEPKSLFDVQNAAYNPEKVKSLRSMKLVYEIKSPEGICNFVLRTAVGAKVRIDIVCPGEMYTACRNGDDFWGYDLKNGFAAVPKRDRADMMYDLAFLPVPFRKVKIFGPLTPDGHGLYGSDARKCNCYKTAMLEYPKMETVLWTDAETGILVLAKSQRDGDTYATRFMNYQDFDGIKLATRINISGPHHTIRMKLLSADWNVSLPDTLFSKSEPGKDSSLVLLQRTVAEKQAAVNAKAAAKTAAQTAVRQPDPAKKEAAAKARLQRQIEKQEKIIRDLKIQIAAKEKKLEQLGMVFKSDREQAAGTLESANRSGYYYRSSWRGWGTSSSSRSATHGARRAAKGLYKETLAIAEEYEKTSKELTDLQIKLGDATVVLEKLNSSK